MVTKIQTKQSISVLNCWAVSGCAVDLAHIVWRALKKWLRIVFFLQTIFATPTLQVSWSDGYFVLMHAVCGQDFQKATEFMAERSTRFVSSECSNTTRRWILCRGCTQSQAPASDERLALKCRTARRRNASSLSLRLIFDGDEPYLFNEIIPCQRKHLLIHGWKICFSQAP